MTAVTVIPVLMLTTGIQSPYFKGYLTNNSPLYGRAILAGAVALYVALATAAEIFGFMVLSGANADSPIFRDLIMAAIILLLVVNMFGLLEGLIFPLFRPDEPSPDGEAARDRSP